MKQSKIKKIYIIFKVSVKLDTFLKRFEIEAKMYLRHKFL